MSDRNATSDNKAVRDFLAEAEEILEQLGSELADLFDMAEGSDFKPDVLNSIFRGAHSLKGLAGMFGFTDISELSHNMENLLDWLRLGKISLDRHLVSLLLDSHELLLSLVRTLSEGGIADNSNEIAECVLRINACVAQQNKPQGVLSLQLLGLPDHLRGALTEYEEHRLLDNLSKCKNIFNVHTSFDLNTFDQELSAVTEILKSCGEVISTLPSIGENMETNIDFEILFGTSSQLADLEGMLGSGVVSVSLLESQAQHDVAAPQPASTIISKLPPTAEHTTKSEEYPTAAGDTSTPQQPLSEDAVVSAKSISRTVRVDIAKLDELMNIVGELVISNSAITAVTTRMRNEGYSRIAIELGIAAKVLERKLSDLQKGVIAIRMIPVGQLYEKMSRIVRKISREQDKKVELKFFGADTELDKLIIEDISDPMMHIIRNAIDHGIETSEKRQAAGKSAKGTIRISSYQKGNHVVIEVEDDGSGIDLEKIKIIALQKGLISDVTSLSEREAIDLIFLPGFSTTDDVSEISGRGVGMDVVRSNIAALSGMVDIETRKGEGSRFIITLPITLAIIKALIVSCSGRTYSIPITSVLESLMVTDREIMTVERREVFSLRETTLPLLRLENYFDISAHNQRPKEFYVVVVGIAEKRLGIVVDDLLGQQDIVIKSLGESFKDFRGVSGAADLGDQRTILVLDVGGIINDTLHSGS